MQSSVLNGSDFYDELWRIINETEQPSGPDITTDGHIKLSLDKVML